MYPINVCVRLPGGTVASAANRAGGPDAHGESLPPQTQDTAATAAPQEELVRPVERTPSRREPAFVRLAGGKLAGSTARSRRRGPGGGGPAVAEQIHPRRTGAVVLPSGAELAGPGLYVAGGGGDPRRSAEQVCALRAGIDLGLTVIDTAGRDAGADTPTGDVEELVAEAVRDRRDDVFLIGRLAVDRLAPHGGVRDDILHACAESLRRLGTDRIDLYLVHGRGRVPLAEIVGAVNLLMTEGHIRHWGVVGFDTADLVELTAVPGGTAVEVDQVDYDLTRRDVEWELLPRCRAARLPVLVRVPAQPSGAAAGPPGALAHPALTTVARRHGVSPDQIRLAWTLRQEGVFAIAEVSAPHQVRHHREALALPLTDADLAELDRAFPPPSGPRLPEGAPARRKPA